MKTMQNTSDQLAGGMGGSNGNEPPPAVHETKLAVLWATFRNILLVVVLMFAFAVLQTLSLWRVCDTGMETAHSLERQGLPNLARLAALQEHIALFRLCSYEYLFAQEAERAGKAEAADGHQEQIRAEIEQIQRLLPQGRGQRLAAEMETACRDLALEFGKVRSLVDSDFAAAMNAMDRDIPPSIQRVTDAAIQLKEFGYEFSGGQANATFSSFGWIKKNAVLFGSGNMAVALGAVLFVVIAARRSRTQLSDALARLDERTRELAGSVSLINATLESTPDGVLAVDRTGKIRAYNQNFVSMWGLQTYLVATRSSETIIALCSVQTKDPGDFVDRIESLRAAPETEHSDLIEFQDGRIIERVAKPQWVGHQCIGTVLNFRDITRRKLAEAELAYERDLLRSLLDYSPDHIYFKDLNSRFIKCSSRQAERFGLEDPNQVAGKTDFDFFALDHARPAFEDEQAIIRTGQPVIGKVEKETWQNSDVSNWVLTSKMPLRNKAGDVIGTFGISKDITAIKQAEAELERVHRQLMDASRKAGMAEVATSVLHNVGNVLNSVNISTSLILDRLGKSKIGNVTRLAALLREHLDDLAAFVATDPAGRQLPAYVARLADRLEAERGSLVEEAKQLQKNVDHIKEIVAMQQSYARMGAVVERINVADLIEDALRMNAGALTRHEVEVVLDYESKNSEIRVEKHKVLQILVNLIRNAKYACDESGHNEKRLTLRLTNGDDRLRIAVIDNGIGIPAENMTRIFNHGFSTRKEGHGFGLHSAALAAKEMGGSLAVHSDGPQRGAVFTLELPLEPPKNSK